MDLVLVIASLQAGGAERVLTRLANAWVDRGYRVTLITLADPTSDFYLLDSRVARLGLDLIRPAPNALVGLWRVMVRVWELRRTLRRLRPTAVVSFTVAINLEVVLAATGLGLPVVISERGEPSRQQLGPLRARGRRWLYPRAAALVVQSSLVEAWFRREIPGLPVTVIANPVMPVSTPLAASAQARQVMAMGRLVSLKGFDLLLRAFALSRGPGLGWQLIIVGEGRERGHLEALARELGIADHLLMPGLMAAPEQELARSPVFVLSSRHEGFPNALLEAMAHGCAVLSFACPSGPLAIIRDAETGILVPPEDVEALARALDGLLMSPGRRAGLGEAARRATASWSPERILADWDRLLSTVSARTSSGHPTRSGR